MTKSLKWEAVAAATVSSVLTVFFYTLWCGKRSGSNDQDFFSGQVEPDEDDPPTQHVAYRHERLALSVIRRRSARFLGLMEQRRTVRFFSSEPVPVEAIRNCVLTACTAPSGAHKQPWSFCAVSDASLKLKIRELVEQEETINYQRRMRQSWVDDVKEMVMNIHDIEHIHKPYLTEAPWLIVVFKQTHGHDKDGKRVDHYYTEQSVGIACGMLVAAIHNANLVTLTSTPLGAEKGIRNLLNRPDNEKVFLLMPIGFPASTATVPYRKLQRKPADQVLFYY